MKIFLKKALLFLIFASVFYCLLMVVWGELIRQQAYKKNLRYYIGYYNAMSFRIKEIAEHKNTDILFLGSSHAYRSFDPRIFTRHGYSSLNLGSSAQTPVQTNMLLEKYLDLIKPGLIVYEVFPFTFSLDGLESCLDMLSADHIDLKTLKMVFSMNQVKAYNTLIFAYYRQLFNRNKNLKTQYTSGDDTYIPGGFVERKLQYFRPKASLSKENLQLKTQQTLAFISSLELIKKRNIPFILVESPITKYKYNSWLNTDSINRFFSGLGPFLNFNGIPGIFDSLDFYDADHLNMNGVAIFCDTLINVLHHDGYLNKPPAEATDPPSLNK